MLFKQKPLLVVLLLFIIFTFAFLASIRKEPKPYNVKEGMDVPACSNNKAPGCYATVMDESIWDDSRFDDLDDYLLKTEIVPPVCPACPSVINQHSHDGEVGSENQGLAGSNYNETNITNINNEEKVVNENNETVNTEVVVQEAAQEEPETNNSQQQGQEQNNQQQISDSLLKQYEKTINDLRGELSNLKQSNGNNSSGNNNGECAPCPAPMRCPEPAFSCQKVINYRSPSAGQYLPMPVLNDFSTFNDS